MLVIGSVATSIFTIMIIFSGNFLQLFFLSFFIGVAGAITKPSAVAISTIEGRKFGMGSMMGIFSSSRDLGMVIAPIASGFVLDVLDINAVFWFGGIMALVGIGFFYFFLNFTKNGK